MATTNQNGIECSNGIVMFAESCGCSEMDASNGDLECSSKFNPRGSNLRIGVCVIFWSVNFSTSGIPAQGFNGLLTYGHRPTCSQMLSSDLQTFFTLLPVSNLTQSIDQVWSSPF
jgi:hypothetical protein